MEKKGAAAPPPEAVQHEKQEMVLRLIAVEKAKAKLGEAEFQNLLHSDPNQGAALTKKKDCTARSVCVSGQTSVGVQLTSVAGQKPQRCRPTPKAKKKCT